MAESRSIARMVRLVSRHLEGRTLFVVLVSGCEQVLLVRFSENPGFRKELGKLVRDGAVGMGVVAIQMDGPARVERCFPFPWRSESPLDDRVCRRIEAALMARPGELLESSGIEIPPRAIV